MEEGLYLWAVEHLGAVLTLGLLLFAAVVALGGLATWRTGRRLGRRPRPWARFAGSLVLLLGGLAGLAVFAVPAVVMGPALVEQGRLAGKTAPELPYRFVADGAEARLADHRGEVVLVNLWATWCPPCRQELPDLDRLQQTYGDEGLVVLQVSDEARETLAEFLADSPMTTEHGYVEEFPWPAFGRPTTFVIDRQGVLRKVIQGARTYEQFAGEVGSYL